VAAHDQQVQGWGCRHVFVPARACLGRVVRADASRYASSHYARAGRAVERRRQCRQRCRTCRWPAQFSETLRDAGGAMDVRRARVAGRETEELRPQCGRSNSHIRRLQPLLVAVALTLLRPYTHACAAQSPGVRPCSLASLTDCAATQAYTRAGAHLHRLVHLDLSTAPTKRTEHHTRARQPATT
jgi:hypothetical protein